jgi:phosphatidylserine decarboxylase
MTIHKEGYTTIALTVLFIMVLNAFVDYKFADLAWLRWFVYILSFALFVIVLQFFRNPTRTLQVSIFMSPVNVHINRNPISGVVKFFKYHPGKYLAAWNPKSSTENERTTTVVEHKNGTPVLFRQIAGALARRIVWYIKEGDQVVQTEQFGFIKFGSRVDIFLPIGTKVNLQLDEVVKGGITILAELS